MKLEQVKSYRTLFGVVFFITLAIFFASSFFSDSRRAIPVTINGANNQIGGFTGETTIEKNSSAPFKDKSNSSIFEASTVVPIASLFVSISSLIGFISTTVLAWRKERREALSHERELEIKNLEIVKLRQGLNPEQNE